MKLAAAFVAVLLLSLTSISAQLPAHVTGFFTDMHAAEGDVLGTEIWIVYARGKFYAAVQEAEGEPDPPMVVPVQVSGAHIAFTIRTPIKHSDGTPAPDEVWDYTGTVTKAGLDLTLGGESETLKRAPS